MLQLIGRWFQQQATGLCQLIIVEFVSLLIFPGYSLLFLGGEPEILIINIAKNITHRYQYINYVQRVEREEKKKVLFL